MKTLSKILAVSGFALASAAGAAHAAGHGPIEIIVVSHGQANDAFWNVAKNGVANAATDMQVNVSYRAPETFDMVVMANLIDAAVAQEPDGLVVTIPDADALGDSIRAAVAAGIPVISMNSGSDVAPGLGVLLHVGQEERDAGVAAGKKMAAMGGTNAICVNHEVGNVALDLRCAGFTEGFGGSVTILPTSNDPATVKANVTAALESDESVDTVLTLGASSAGEPALAAIKELGLLGTVNIGTFDMSANMLKAIDAGEAAFAIDQQQYLQGYLPVVFLANLARYGVIPGGNVPSGPNLITQEKAAQVIDLSAQGLR